MFLQQMASVSGGTVAHTTGNQRQTKEMLKGFFKAVTSSPLKKLRFSFGRARISEILPQRSSDLIHDRPFVVSGRFSEGFPKSITLSGETPAGNQSFLVPVKTNHGTSKIWALAKTNALLRKSSYSRSVASIANQLRQIALEHSLVSPFTSLLIVDSKK